MAAAHPSAVAPAPVSADLFTTPDLPPAALAFRQWAEAYRRAEPAAQAGMVARGVVLARAQRETLRPLIPTNPQLALAAATPMVLRQDLPPQVESELETRVQAVAFYGVLATTPGSDAPAIRREVRFDGQRYDAYVYGNRQSQRTTERTMIQGVAVEQALAVSEDRVRRLEVGERPNPAKPRFLTCAISGKQAAAPPADDPAATITDETPAYETPSGVHFVCSGGHIRNVEDDARREEGGEPPTAQEGSTGGPMKPTGSIPSTYATGVKSVLYIRVTFPDQNADPQSEKDAAEIMRQASDFFVENSYGRVYLQTAVTPLLVMPRTAASYIAETDGVYSLLQDARNAAKAAGYDYLAFDQEAVRYNGGPGSFGGQAYVGARGTWLKTSNLGTACHEFGHNLGLWHANSWDTSPPSVIGPGVNGEYGDIFDTMGVSSAGNSHFNSNHKSLLSWLTDDLYTTVRGNGLYRIYPMDQPIADPAKRYALKVVRDSDRDYWLEYRSKFAASNNWARDGVFLHWSAWGTTSGDNSTSPSSSNGGAQLLDTTPGSPDGKTDAPLVIGRTFADPEADLYFTPVGKGGTTPESIDIVVNRGPFPGNGAPTLAVQPSTLSAATGASLTFTATAADPDGDALAYAWDFGDKTWGANAASVTKSWTTAGRYNVSCTVSDMKGGSVTVQTLVTTGISTAYVVRGRVIDTNGLGLAGVRVDNGGTGTLYRGALTDSQGYYAITGLANGTYTLRALHANYSFAATQTLTLSGDRTGVDFFAVAVPTVTMTAPDASATEGSDTAVLRFTRTGDTTNALTIRLLAPNGAAVFGTDYTPNPGLTASSGIYTLTVPAGAATLDVTLTPVNDTTAEGPEGANFFLLPTTDYRVAGSQTVSVTINDNDTALPRVGVAALDNTASETGDPASFVLRCDPAPTTAVNVALSYGGTAANGTDYDALPATVAIQPGQTSVTVPVTARDDSEAEGTETLLVTVAANAAYLRAPEATTASLLILDDDLNTVTVAATDASASEASTDPGVFTITRTGNLARELAVDYALGGTAVHGKDYQRLPGRVTIPAGVASVPLVIQPIDDSIGEPTQTVVLQLRAQSGYLVGSPGTSATINLTDNDQPAFSVVPFDGVATEPASGTATDTARFRIYRAGGTAAVTVAYTLGGTAVQGTDYVTLTGTVDFTASDTFKDIIITPLADATPTAEDSETVVLTLTPGTGYAVEPEDHATVRIFDNQPMVSISTKNSVVTTSETATSAPFYISRTGSTTVALTVNYTMGGTATNGADYNALSGTVTIPAGLPGVDLLLVPINDTLVEGTETAVLTVQPGTGYGVDMASAQFSIADNDGTLSQSVAFPTSTTAVPENVGYFTITVQLSASAASSVSVNYAVSGGTATGGLVDYSLPGGTLTFPPGTTTQNITVRIVDDPFPEDNETLTITLSNALGAALVNGITHTVTINDNDSAPQANVGFRTASSSSSESVAVPNTAVVTLDRAASQTVTVTYATGGTATLGTDYTLTGTSLVFLPGEVAKPIPLTVINDTLSETDEMVAITLTGATGAALNSGAASHTLTIQDDDPPVVTITASDAQAGEFGADTGAWTITRTGNTASALTVNFLFQGTAFPEQDYQLSAAGGSFTSLTPRDGAVTLPASTASVVVTLIPVADTVSEGSETATFVLLPGSGYGVGTSDRATVTIKDLPIDDWRWRKFGAANANNPAVAGDLADPDKDGWPNLWEYPLGGDPNQADARSLPLTVAAGTATLTYYRAEGTPDVSVQAIWSDDLTTWRTDLISDTPVGQSVNGMTQHQVTLPVDAGPGRRFMRLRILR